MATSNQKSLESWKVDFLNDCLSNGVLKFGTFTLKSKRISPYFFNAGLFHTGNLVESISKAYASTLSTSTVQFDVLFGPAYKGIPLAATTVGKLTSLQKEKYGNVSYSFNRKEAKDHGEGGTIVGASMKDKSVVIIDDVITAGTAIREAIDIIVRQGGTLVGIIVAFDRMEKTPSQRELQGDMSEVEGEPTRMSAIGEIRKQYGVPVLSILTLEDVLDFLRGAGTEDDVKRLEEYRRRYKASD
ncbi:orotate phosphoribosyltransferase [Patellaria atrata CBS 101060]|uniref:Orotate phosphoribosyltransferase n=1 Tax=Patellaria atrata CBS 101060 TaxID=1346257 RepID=A0A9P4S493_9PEZI|nr:orotate phosphoribosyltransferase [Patellaria atrata CBS 101060]